MRTNRMMTIFALLITLAMVTPAMAFGPPRGGRGMGPGGLGPMGGPPSETASGDEALPQGEEMGPGRQGPRQGGPGGPGGGIMRMIQALPAEDVSEAEAADLNYMIEEEKLARDLYLALFQLWNDRIFFHIAYAEQRHMDAVKAILDKYEMADPAGENRQGVFDNPELQNLYDTLYAAGSASLMEALTAGAAVEEIDITDLNNAIETADNEDIRLVYQHLLRGSMHHLRGYVHRIEELEGTYTPQYLSQEEFDEITAAPQEREPVDENGEPSENFRGPFQGMGGFGGNGQFPSRPGNTDTEPLTGLFQQSWLQARGGGNGGGNGGHGGHGPGDGSGNGGSGPRDGSGPGSGWGDCPFDLTQAPMPIMS